MEVVVEETLTSVEVSGPTVTVLVPAGAVSVVAVDEPPGSVAVESPPSVVTVDGPSTTVAVPTDSVGVLDVGIPGPQGPIGPAGPGGGADAVRETPAGAVDGVNAAFTLSAAPLSGSERVYLNGLLQEPGGGNDYVLAGAVVTFSQPPQPGDIVRVVYAVS